MTTPDKPSAAAEKAAMSICLFLFEDQEGLGRSMFYRRLVAAINAELAPEREAVERLVKFARHEIFCPANTAPQNRLPDCDYLCCRECGLDAALDKLKSAREGVNP